MWDAGHVKQDLLGTLEGDQQSLNINDSGQMSGNATMTYGSNLHEFVARPAAYSPAFSALPEPTVEYGTVLSGHLADGANTPPAGETVAVTINGVTQNATLDSAGNFSLGTAGLDIGAYSVSFSHFGDSTFGGIACSTLTVQVVSSDHIPPQLTLPADQTFAVPYARGVAVHFAGATASDDRPGSPAVPTRRPRTRCSRSAPLWSRPPPPTPPATRP